MPPPRSDCPTTDISKGADILDCSLYNLISSYRASPEEKKPALPASFYHHSDWQNSTSLTTRIHTGLVMCRDTVIADDTVMGTVGFGDTGDTWPRDWEPAEPFPPLWDVLLPSEAAPGTTSRLLQGKGGHFPYKNKPLPQLPRRRESASSQPLGEAPQEADLVQRPQPHRPTLSQS